jgi:hypothetical protein
VNKVSATVSSLDGKSDNPIVIEDMIVEIGNILNAMVVDGDEKMARVKAAISLDEQGYEFTVAEIDAGVYAFDITQFRILWHSITAIPHSSKSVGTLTSAHTMPFHLTPASVSDYDTPLIHPTISSTGNAVRQPSPKSVDLSTLAKAVPASTSSAQKKGASKVVKAMPGYLDMSRFVVKTPFKEWTDKDVETSWKQQLVWEAQRVAIEEIKRDSEERALIEKQAGQNKRQKKCWEKTVQKEIVEGVRDDSGKIKKKQKVGQIGVPFSCYCC